MATDFNILTSRKVICPYDAERYALKASQVDVGDIVYVAATGAWWFVSNPDSLSSDSGYDLIASGSDAPTFTSVTTTGAVTVGTNLTVGGVAKFANGTGAVPSISFTNDPDTGLFWTGIANRIGISLGGVESATFRGNGSGAFEIESGGTNQNITFTASGSGKVIFNSGLSNNSGDFVIQSAGAFTVTPAGVINLIPGGSSSVWVGASTSSGRPTGAGQVVMQNTTVGAALGGLEFQYATSGSGYGARIGTSAATDAFYIQTRFNSATWTDRIEIAATANGNITLMPSGTGSVVSVQTSSSANNTVTGSAFLANRTSAASEQLALRVKLSAGISGLSNPGQLVSNGNNVFELYTVGAHPLVFGASATELARMAANGNWLFGTTTDSSNGRIQLATHTTSAGGIGFGPALSLYQSAARVLNLDGAGQTELKVTNTASTADTGIRVVNTSGTALFAVDASGALFIPNFGNTRIYSGSSTLALTLDSSQNASFTGTITTAAGKQINSGSHIRLDNTSQIFWLNRSSFLSPSDGVITLANNAVTDFNRLQFGGTTSSFPALKRSGANLQARLADDSGFSDVLVDQIVTNNGTFLVSDVALTDGAAAAVGTLSNAPVAGNPTKWIPISDNGTTRYIPAW